MYTTEQHAVLYRYMILDYHRGPLAADLIKFGVDFLFMGSMLDNGRYLQHPSWWGFRVRSGTVHWVEIDNTGHWSHSVAALVVNYKCT